MAVSSSLSSDFPEDPPQLSLSSDQMQHCHHALDYLMLKCESSNLIKLEFETLEAKSMKESDVERLKTTLCTVAIDDVNLDKNRYPNVLPFDTNRVVLTPRDYINASFVKSSAECAPKFIATQAPLPNTFKDFWEMVLKHRCPVIVMLTKLVEKEKLKCHVYFQAEDGPSEFGNISVVTKWTKPIGSSLIFRGLQVIKAESQEPPLPVLHIQYLDWPDYGTPEDSSAVREIFRRTFHQPPNVGPILVHCSAGIGRTGTYCTIHATIERILAGDLSALDFSETIKAFRSQRAGMVRKKDLYEFCYKAVIDELKELISKGIHPCDAI